MLSEEKAIVSEIAGTTRDSIEDVISIRGIHFRLIDTAGLRHTSDEIEKLGIERTWQKIDQASIIIQVLDMDSDPDEIVRLRNQLLSLPDAQEKRWIVVLNKMDLVSPDALRQLQSLLEQIYTAGEMVIPLSAKSGTNLAMLEQALIRASGAAIPMRTMLSLPM